MAIRVEWCRKATVLPGGNCFRYGNLGGPHGLQLAYTALAGDLPPVGAARGPGAPRALRPRRYPRGEQLHLRNAASRIPPAVGWQHVSRIVVTAAYAQRVDFGRRPCPRKDLLLGLSRLACVVLGHLPRDIGMSHRPRLRLHQNWSQFRLSGN
jgi:hypothetical protein